MQTLDSCLRRNDKYLHDLKESSLLVILIPPVNRGMPRGENCDKDAIKKRIEVGIRSLILSFVISHFEQPLGYSVAKLKIKRTDPIR